jgi:hypothetical protein
LAGEGGVERAQLRVESQALKSVLQYSETVIVPVYLKSVVRYRLVESVTD